MRREKVNRDRYNDPPWDDEEEHASKIRELDQIEELEQGLEIDEHALDEALQRQPDLFYRVSKQLAIMTSRRDAAKQAIQNAEAEVELEIRQNLGKRDEKLTDKAVAARVRNSGKVKKAMASYLVLNGAVMQFTALKEAFQQRSYALKSLADLHMASYFQTESISDVSNRHKTMRAERVRSKMADMRRRQ